MKIILFAALAASASLTLVSCDSGMEEKIGELEKKAAEATERQRHLEAELAQQKLSVELEAIERERTLIERERIAMEEERDERDAAAAAALAQRQLELDEREKRISEMRGEMESREQNLTGLERDLKEKELDRAGQEPLSSLPPIQKKYVSGPTADFSNFYEPLGNYGSWFNTSDYGYVYQPTVVRDTTWRPYTRGRWAFTNQGWTWVSDEPFGWACYHYGRWALLRNSGWVWVPGNQWAPAWVTWRESPQHIGWAPLPPETLAWRDRSWDSSVEVKFGIGSTWFSFVSYSHFGSPIYRNCLPIGRNTIFFRESRNITRYRIDNYRVFLGGPRYERVCNEIGRRFPVHRLNLEEYPDFDRNGRIYESRFSGQELQVIAPRMDATWNKALRPKRVRADLGDVKLERTREISEDVRARYRESREKETLVAERFVADAGGREDFERERRERLKQSREVARENGLGRRSVNSTDKSSEITPSIQTESPRVDSVDQIPDTPSIDSERTGRRRKPDGTGSAPVLPEPPPSPPQVEPPTGGVPTLPEPAPEPRRPDRRDRPGKAELPPGVTPAQGLPNPPTGEGFDNETSGVGRDGKQRPIIPTEQPDDNSSKRENRRNPQAIVEVPKDRIESRHNEAEARNRTDRAALEKVGRQQEQSQRDASRQRRGREDRNAIENTDQSQQDENLKGMQEQQERVRLQQAEIQKRNRDQQERARSQQEEQSRKGQRDESIRLAQEQQKRLRVQQEEEQRRETQQEELRRQAQVQREREIQQQDETRRQAQVQREREIQRQEEIQRRAQEQQERARQRDEAQSLRRQQEQMQRAREQEQEIRQQQIEMQRGVQEAQERAAQRQEEARRQQEEMQRRVQEQQERAAQQQEQARRQQEEMQRRVQEQQERIRQQQQEIHRRAEEQEKQMRQGQEPFKR